MKCFRQVTALVVGLLAVATQSVWGSALDRSVRVCVDERVKLGSRVGKAFRTELNVLSQAAARFVDCSQPTSIRISIRSHAPARYETALGLAYAAGDRVLPVIELYVVNILRTLGRQIGSDSFGRALARVAFHELEHYNRQQRHHDTGGLFAPSLTGTHLLTDVRRR